MRCCRTKPRPRRADDASTEFAHRTLLEVEAVSSHDVQPLILVADDEAHIRMVVAERLRAEGFRVIEAQDGEEAWELVQEQIPAAVVTDLQMPFMNGLEFCQKLRQHPATSQTPAIMLTARGHILDKAQVGSTNIRQVIGKPFGVRELVNKVKEMLKTAETTAAGTVSGADGTQSGAREAA